MPFAALDLGTNTFRLLIAERMRGRPPWRRLDCAQAVVRLGEGLAAQGRLDPAARARAAGSSLPCAASPSPRRTTACAQSSRRQGGRPRMRSAMSRRKVLVPRSSAANGIQQEARCARASST